MPGDAAKLANQIDAANAAAYRLDALRLNSSGGNVWEAFQMAIMVRSVWDMATAVYKQSVCVSACFGVFAGGWRKYVNLAPNQIGVHSTSIATGQETPQTQATTTFAARRLSAIGVPEKIIAKIILTPPDKVYYLTLDDLWSMGVNVTGIPRLPAAGPAPMPPQDPDPLYVARVVRNINLNDGTEIPSGTLVVIWDQCSHVDASQRFRIMCSISYVAGEVSKSTSVVLGYLRVIGQSKQKTS